MGIFCLVELVVGKVIVPREWIHFPDAKTLCFWQRVMKSESCPAEGRSSGCLRN